MATKRQKVVSPMLATRGPLDPPASLLVKLGSIAVHADELLGPGGRPDFDGPAIQTVLQDPEVVAWIAVMTKEGFLPVKR